MTPRAPIVADYPAGAVEEVKLHDGSVLRLRKLAADYDVHDRIGAMTHLQERRAAGEIVTGLVYLEDQASDLHEHLGTVAVPLNGLGEAELCPGSDSLAKVNAGLR
jgi:2-oxoglutarate ferredoxin oxidoreductase subunit beta